MTPFLECCPALSCENFPLPMSRTRNEVIANFFPSAVSPLRPDDALKFSRLNKSREIWYSVLRAASSNLLGVFFFLCFLLRFFFFFVGCFLVLVFFFFFFSSFFFCCSWRSGVPS